MDDELLNKPLLACTLGDFKAILTQVLKDNELDSLAAAPPKKYVYGLAGLMKLFGCSISTAERIKQSGVIDGALLEQLHDTHMPVSKKLQKHRALCGCTDSIDIGGWPIKKCWTGCQYCYARSSY